VPGRKIVFGEDRDPVGLEKRPRDPDPLDERSAVGAVVDLAAAAGRASGLQDRYGHSRGLGCLKRPSGPGQIGVGNVLAAGGRHPGPAGQNVAAVASHYLGRGPRGRKPAFHLRTHREGPAGCNQVGDALVFIVSPVEPTGMAGEAAGDQDEGFRGTPGGGIRA
jgi:hypothetical protein